MPTFNIRHAHIHAPMLLDMFIIKLPFPPLAVGGHGRQCGVRVQSSSGLDTLRQGGCSPKSLRVGFESAVREQERVCSEWTRSTSNSSRLTRSGGAGSSCGGLWHFFCALTNCGSIEHTQARGYLANPGKPMLIMSRPPRPPPRPSSSIPCRPPRSQKRQRTFRPLAARGCRGAHRPCRRPCP